MVHSYFMTTEQITKQQIVDAALAGDFAGALRLLNVWREQGSKKVVRARLSCPCTQSVDSALHFIVSPELCNGVYLERARRNLARRLDTWMEHGAE